MVPTPAHPAQGPKYVVPGNPSLGSAGVPHRLDPEGVAFQNPDSPTQHPLEIPAWRAPTSSENHQHLKEGAILREKKVIIPRSDFIFKKDDRVVFIVKKDVIHSVENIFRLSSV